MYALWQRDIEIETPRDSGVWERAKPVGFLLGGAPEMARDLMSWFAPPVFFQCHERGPVFVDEDTRVYHFIGRTTRYRVTYSVMERTANVGGISIPLEEEPIQRERQRYQWDQDF